MSSLRQDGHRMIAQFALTIMYTQIVVATGTTPYGLLWTDQHVAQGFAWSRDVVAFGVPDHDGQVLVQVDSAPTASVDAGALWAVQVPFTVLAMQPLEIGTILDERPVDVPTGQYDLVFEAMPAETIRGRAYTYVLRLKFSPTPSPSFKILKKGNELKTDNILRTDAEIAR